MPSARILSCLLLSACLVLGIGKSGFPDPPKLAEGRAVSGPWGISSSASSFKNHAEWFPKMADAGVSTVRLFPEWRSFEPTPGTWNWSQGDLLMKSAVDHRIEINAVLMGSPPGMKAIHVFPMDNLDEWSNYVSAVVDRYHPQVRHWEVWNEGNGGFNDGKHTTSDYAKLAIATYEAAKKADPQAKVGLTVASFDTPYLHQTMRAMVQAGKSNCFDYLCIHPYEIADGLSETDGEIPFLWMSHYLRASLKEQAPERSNAEIWITEVGRRIEKKANHNVTEQVAAKDLAKIYTMAIAQGIARTQWFEAQDPVGEDQGFGLLNRNGSPRPAYNTLKLLTSQLGPNPKYEGWIALGHKGRGYGFVITGRARSVLIAWMPVGLEEHGLQFSADVEVTNLLDATSTKYKAGQLITLTDVPVVVTDLAPEFVQNARSNAGKNFPWGGDFSTTRTVSGTLGTDESSSGIVLIDRARYPKVRFPDGSTGILVPGDIGHAASFYLHPSFASLQTREYYVRATVRRVADGNVGMNLLYQVVDSQGRSPYVNAGQWFGASKDSGWQTYTWRVKNACFTKTWGYDLVLRPEQSIPFVIGKLEVSTEPFR